MNEKKKRMASAILILFGPPLVIFLIFHFFGAKHPIALWPIACLAVLAQSRLMAAFGKTLPDSDADAANDIPRQPLTRSDRVIVWLMPLVGACLVGGGLFKMRVHSTVGEILFCGGCLLATLGAMGWLGRNDGRGRTG